MNQVDRLMIKAKRLATGGLEVCVGMTVPDGDQWKYTAHLWDGVNPATIDTALHTTKDDAIDYLHKLAEEYPNSRDVSIIVFDV